MKRKIFVLAVAALCMAIAVGGTMAFYTAEDVAHNVITTGNVKIDIVETREVQAEDGQSDIVPFPENGVMNVMPATDQSKIVQVRNTGAGSAWVCLQVNPEITGVDNVDLPWWTETDEGKISLISMDFDVMKEDSKWILEDNKFYYKTPLKPGEITDPLFTTVYFDKHMGNDYQRSVLEITVTASAVQSDNNPIPKGGTVAQVAGWPTPQNG